MNITLSLSAYLALGVAAYVLGLLMGIWCRRSRLPTSPTPLPPTDLHKTLDSGANIDELLRACKSDRI